MGIKTPMSKGHPCSFRPIIVTYNLKAVLFIVLLSKNKEL